jgi:hypothetical protein
MPRDNATTVTPDLLTAATALADAERQLTEVLDDLSRARATRHDAHTHRDDLIRTELSRNVPVVELCKVTGLSRARIYQIRDGKS